MLCCRVFYPEQCFCCSFLFIMSSLIFCYFFQNVDKLGGEVFCTHLFLGAFHSFGMMMHSSVLLLEARGCTARECVCDLFKKINYFIYNIL